MNTIAAFRCQRIARQDGVAAVELAILAAVLYWFLASALFIAHSVMQATVVQRAANNAAHMIANYPQYLRSDPSVDLDTDATNMVIDELVAGGIAPSSIGTVGSYCTGSASCFSKAPPGAVGVAFSAAVVDPSSVLPTIASVAISASASDRYAN